MRNMLRKSYAVGASIALFAVASSAYSIQLSNVVVNNDSSDAVLVGNRQFETQSTLFGVTSTQTSSVFSHRMAARNSHLATGGTAQTHKRNVVFQITFTVDDPTNHGYALNLSALTKGVSRIEQSIGSSQALATGLTLDTRVKELSDPNSEFQFLGSLSYSTASATVTGIGSNLVVGENSGEVALGQFVGTRTFQVNFTSVTTPTTNVLFQNNAQGSGDVLYGLGDIPAGLGLQLDDLGHFFTVEATFEPIPEPATLASLALGGLILSRRRRSR